MELGLQGKVVAITGPAKGMGPAITAAFVQEGCDVILVGRDIDAMAPVEAAAKAAGVQTLIAPCDVTDGAQTESCMDAARARFGRIDILVNVAGGSGPVGVPSWETTTAEFEDIIKLNMTGCFNTMRAVLPDMIARRSGKIVNVGGTFGLRGRAGRMAYSASKWGLRGITKSTALEVGAFNINVNCVAPGMVDGPRFRDKVVASLMHAKGMTADEAIASHADEYALGRISTAEDIANACLFLASDVSRQITGVDIPVDGGWAAL